MKNFFKNFFKLKHKFDLENPEIVLGSGYPFQRYHCKNCHKTLCLELWQMLALSPEECPGDKIKKEKIDDKI